MRETRWLDLAPTFTALGAAGTAALLNVLTTEEKALRPFTVVRSRGILGIESDQTAASEVYHAAFGMAVVSEQAIAIGVTAVPTPDTDRASDLWFVFEELLGSYLFATSAAFVESSATMRIYDSKAMRKIEDGQDLAVVAEAVVNSAGLLIRSAGRVLIKLH